MGTRTDEIAMHPIRTDVLVIGTGFGAAAATLRLAEAGFHVVVLEKGPDIVPERDFRQTQDPQYLSRYLRGVSGDHIGMTYAEGLGGGSGFYEMVSLRAPTLAFAQRDSDGRPLWPVGVDRRALTPYYEIGERMLKVQQIPADQVPKTGQVFSLMMKRLGYSCERARYAMRGCVGSGFCVTGCIYGAKQSLHLNYLPGARAAGAMIETNIEAVAVRALRRSSVAPEDGELSRIPYRFEVAARTTDAARSRRLYHTRLLILGGGTVGTARLLLASRRNLPRLSARLGEGIGFNGSVKVAALLPPDLPDGDMFTGLTHPGMISYHFLESHGMTVSAAKALPLQLVASARLRLPGAADEHGWWGAPQVELMRSCRRRMIILYSLSLTPPAARMTLRADGSVRVALDLTSELRDMYARQRAVLEAILERNGCQLIDATLVTRTGVPRPSPFFGTTHQTGSCRMADTPDQGVIDGGGEVFGYPGMYVVDGASIPSSLAINVSLTILANAERIAQGVVTRYRRS